ncbi:hypothetical protein NUW58_g5882 [Xylaria curta]|uniref:Uncharacterized protein n=1 Tax=Xylaria curta TaxID=42375 RepID=A0ACC1NZG6_9PEZI|nr:hypothetical protein NUW58_g5882 [Xylaria curta]
MTSEVPEKGDKVSWSWGGGAPGGTVAETKDEGEIAIKSNRGNTIKKNASPGNPAVHVERSGNNVVKRASELTVDEKAPRNKNKEDGDGSSKRKAESQEDLKSEANRDENETTEAGGPANQHVTNKQGKEVKKGGKDANKKRKTRQDGDVKGKTDGSKASEEDEEDEEIAEDHEANEEGNEGEETEEKKDQDAGPRRDDSEKKYAKAKRIEVDLSKNKIKSPGTSKTGEEKDSAAQKNEDQVSTRTRSHDKGGLSQSPG